MVTLIWCHGGCFSGGNASYDKQLREYLEKNGIKVISVEFSTDSWNEALLDVIRTSVLCNEPHILGGVSSGGMIAHQAANIVNRPAFLLCPVFKPADRHSSLEEKFQKMQLNFFDTVENMEKYQNDVKAPNRERQIIFGNQDERARLDAISGWTGTKNLTVHIVSGDHSLCKYPPLELCLQCINSMPAS